MPIKDDFLSLSKSPPSLLFSVFPKCSVIKATEKGSMANKQVFVCVCLF